MSFKSTHGPLPIAIGSCARAQELGIDRRALRAETLVLRSQTKSGLQRILVGVFHNDHMLCVHRGVVLEDGEDWASYKCVKWLDLNGIPNGDIPGHDGYFAVSEARVSQHGNEYYFRHYEHCSHMVLCVEGSDAAAAAGLASVDGFDVVSGVVGVDNIDAFKEIICTECREK